MQAPPIIATGLDITAIVVGPQHLESLGASTQLRVSAVQLLAVLLRIRIRAEPVSNVLRTLTLLPTSYLLLHLGLATALYFAVYFILDTVLFCCPIL